MKSISPSAIDTVAYWASRESKTDEELIEDLMGSEETQSMRIGEAWHSVVQSLATGQSGIDELEYDEIKFVVDADIALPFLVEVEKPVSLLMSVSGEPVLVNGKIDGIDAAGQAHEFKTRARTIGRLGSVWQHYFSKNQWRCYTLALNATGITYHVFQRGRVKKSKSGELTVPIKAYWSDTFETYSSIREDLTEAVDLAVDVIDHVCPQYWSRNDREPDSQAPDAT